MTGTPPAERTYVVRANWVNLDDRYVKTYVVGVGKVTFSFKPEHGVWQEVSLPIQGAKVVLSDLRLMDGGWRAFEARYFRPEDEGCK